jgi:hypothetical protein
MPASGRGKPHDVDTIHPRFSVDTRRARRTGAEPAAILSSASVSDPVGSMLLPGRNSVCRLELPQAIDMRKRKDNPMKRATTALLIALAGATLLGCRPTNPPPPRVPVPTQQGGVMIREHEAMRPLPPPAFGDPSLQPPFDDPPLVSQRPPEQRVGSPRITLFVNRTLQGQLVPVNPDDPLLTLERTRRASGDLTLERTETDRRYWDDRQQRTDRFEARGPAEYRDTFDVYLRPGQYDEVHARSIDYEAIENIMADWIASNGQVTVISPIMARQRLTDQQVRELQEGRPQVLSEIAQQLDTDVLIQVQARPTRQTRHGLEVRILAEAINTRGGESIGRAVVDVPPPLEKMQINDYTRYLARKLMDDMSVTWRSAPPPAARRDDRSPPQLQQDSLPQPPMPLRQPPASPPPADVRSLPATPTEPIAPAPVPTPNEAVPAAPAEPAATPATAPVEPA